MITEPETAVEQIMSIVEQARVESINGKWLPLQAQSICVHSDTPGALDHLTIISNHLIARGIHIGAI